MKRRGEYVKVVVFQKEARNNDVRFYETRPRHFVEVLERGRKR